MTVRLTVRMPTLGRRALWLVVLTGAFAPLHAAQIDIPGPPGSTTFGDRVRVLPNGNIVVVDQGGPVSDIGAMHLYSPAGELISTLTGGSAGDRIGSGGIVVLSSGNFLLRSPDWDNTTGPAIDAGAITWVDGALGLSGVVSADNSLVGSSDGDSFPQAVILLENGNYVVSTSEWDSATAIDVGAVTWGHGEVGVRGAISSANSLIGLTADDNVGSFVAELANGNYVICSGNWDSGATIDVGAATWSDGASGRVGLVSASSSLVGTQARDRVCDKAAVALSNGHYVVLSSDWDNATAGDAGAATWGNGQGGTVGPVTTVNSFVGRAPGESTGSTGYALTNGNYLIGSPGWTSGSAALLGAITLLNGDGPVAASAGPAISLVGSSEFDQVGAEIGLIPAAVALSTGNYVVVTRFWDNGAASDAGAVTWGNGVGGTVGVISPGNSLVGTSESDQVGSSSVIALTNGHYVVGSSLWDNGATANVGAATWGNGGGGTVGPVSIVNSLIGSSVGDQVGILQSFFALANGNYVVRSSRWDSGAVRDAGAVTWGDGTVGVRGTVSAANSLVGSSQDDFIGSKAVLALDNGNYVVGSPAWDSGDGIDVGAVTLVSGSVGLSGAVSAGNSLLGTTTGDQISLQGLIRFSDSSFAIASALWDNGAMVDAGAATLAVGNRPLVGQLASANSVLGGTAVGGSTRSIDYDTSRRRLAVGRPAENLLSLLVLEQMDEVFVDGFE